MFHSVQKHLALGPQEYVSMFVKAFPHVKVHPANPSLPVFFGVCVSLGLACSKAKNALPLSLDLSHSGMLAERDVHHRGRRREAECGDSGARRQAHRLQALRPHQAAPVGEKRQHPACMLRRTRSHA